MGAPMHDIRSAALELDAAMRLHLVVLGRGRHAGRVRAAATELRRAMTRAVIAAADLGLAGTPDEALEMLDRLARKARRTGAVSWRDVIDRINTIAEEVPHG